MVVVELIVELDKLVSVVRYDCRGEITSRLFYGACEIVEPLDKGDFFSSGTTVE